MHLEARSLGDIVCQNYEYQFSFFQVIGNLYLKKLIFSDTV